MQNPELLFQQRAADFAQHENQQARQHRLVGLARGLVFLAGAWAAGYLFYTGRNGWGFLVLFGFYLLFAWLMRLHDRVGYRMRHFRYLARINHEELLRLKGELLGFAGGHQYQNPLHPYTSDLDIFGNYSLFQLLNRATTAIGQGRLALFLQKAAAPTEITARQQAIAELAADVDWRQHFQARGLHFSHKNAQAPAFFEWLHQAGFFAKRPLLKVLVFALPLLTIGAAVLWYLTGMYYPFVALALVQYVVGYRYASQRDEAYGKSEGMNDVLRTYTALLKHLEGQPWSAELLVQLQQRMQLSGKSASVQMQQLSVIIDYFSARLNTFVGFLVNSILMWDFYWMWRLERWKATMHHRLEPLLDALAETETLASLAAFQFANPGYAVPQLSEQTFQLQADALGHPLIVAGKRVSNSFALAGEGSTAVITGSNMSGKSTFLRTLGLNLVLANCGAAVCAQQMQFYPMQLFTSMRTQDDLSESTSSFYAELKRLRVLLDLTETGRPVFYLLDEILKGTNSRDRHLGARALIKQLQKQHTFGLISTHDLELGQLEKELPGRVQNYSFNSQVTDGKLLFDYRLQPGICQSFNAAKLMEMIGIEMEG